MKDVTSHPVILVVVPFRIISAGNGLVSATDAVTGKLLWKHKTGNSLVTLINTVVPLNSKDSLFTSSEGIAGLLSYQE
ncbi:MAG: hypothetical protein LBR26_17205 [Prevotella sp.]|jgi:outer membrane protein assembly factor BamB|nr:hypothetical protein [Prevotella sp.]